MDSRPPRELPEGIHLPAPSYQPFWLALGVLLVAIGVIWTPIISAVGLLLAALALMAWTQEIRRAALDEEEIEHE